MDQDVQENLPPHVSAFSFTSGNLKGKKQQLHVFRFSCMFGLYFCLIRGEHGILIGVVCSPNYSWLQRVSPRVKHVKLSSENKAAAFLVPQIITCVCFSRVSPSVERVSPSQRRPRATSAASPRATVIKRFS